MLKELVLSEGFRHDDREEEGVRVKNDGGGRKRRKKISHSAIMGVLHEGNENSAADEDGDLYRLVDGRRKSRVKPPSPSPPRSVSSCFTLTDSQRLLIHSLRNLNVTILLSTPSSTLTPRLITSLLTILGNAGEGGKIARVMFYSDALGAYERNGESVAECIVENCGGELGGRVLVEIAVDTDGGRFEELQEGVMYQIARRAVGEPEKCRILAEIIKVRGGEERRLERSDSKSIIPHFYMPNNLPLVASLVSAQGPGSGLESRSVIVVFHSLCCLKRYGVVVSGREG